MFKLFHKIVWLCLATLAALLGSLALALALSTPAGAYTWVAKPDPVAPGQTVS